MKIITCVGARLDKYQLERLGLFKEFCGGHISEYPEIKYDYPILIDAMARLLEDYSEWGLVIITNSPYIVDIIEVLTAQHSIECRYINYIFDKEGVDCTDDLESLYLTMAAPLQVLENMRYADI